MSRHHTKKVIIFICQNSSRLRHGQTIFLMDKGRQPRENKSFIDKYL